MEKKKITEINGKKYTLSSPCDTSMDSCQHCALLGVCDKSNELLCHKYFGRDVSFKSYLVEVPDDALTEQEVYDYYQERSEKANIRATQLAWIFIVMMTAGLISGSAFRTFSICAALSAVYMLLSVVQAIWQTFTSWLFLQHIKNTNKMPSDYPSWVGGGAWFFWWLKMIAITAAVIYFVHSVFFNL